MASLREEELKKFYNGSMEGGTYGNADLKSGPVSGSATGIPSISMGTAANQNRTPSLADMETDAGRRAEELYNKAAELAKIPGTKMTTIRALTSAAEGLAGMEAKRSGVNVAERGQNISLAELEQRGKIADDKLALVTQGQATETEYKRGLVDAANQRLGIERARDYNIFSSNKEENALKMQHYGNELAIAQSKLSADALDAYRGRLTTIYKNPKFFESGVLTEDGQAAIDAIKKEHGIASGKTLDFSKYYK